MPQTTLISRSQIEHRVAEMGRQITADFAGSELIACCVLKGAMFFCSDLIRQINLDLFRYNDIAVEGEVTNYTRSSAGHHYFSIKDSRAQMRVVMFATNARFLRFRIENGLQLIVRGRLTIYEQKGEFQLAAFAAEPAGLGALQLAFEQLKRTRGSIIFITAPMAYMAHAYQAHVGPAKAGVEMLMKNLALEWGPYGIRSNSIIPGFIEDTEGMRRISSDADSRNFIQSIPLRRLGMRQEIGQAALFLSSPLAAYITGTSLWVDGGQALSGSGFFNNNSAAFLASNPRA